MTKAGQANLQRIAHRLQLLSNEMRSAANEMERESLIPVEHSKELAGAANTVRDWVDQIWIIAK